LRDSIEEEESHHDAFVAKKRAELSALKEELRDLRFYVSTLQQVQKSPDAHEINSGTIVMVEPASNRRPPRKT
jgi:hypothetical protein